MQKPLLPKKMQQGRTDLALQNLLESSFIPHGDTVHASLYARHDSTQILDDGRFDEFKIEKDIRFAVVIARMNAVKEVFMECLIEGTSIFGGHWRVTKVWTAWKAVGKKRILLQQIQSLEELLATVPIEVEGKRGGSYPACCSIFVKAANHHAAFLSEDLGLGPCHDAGLVATLEMLHLLAFMYFLAVSSRSAMNAKTFGILTNPPPPSLMSNPIMLWQQFRDTSDFQPAVAKKNGASVLAVEWMDLRSNLMPVVNQWTCEGREGFNDQLESLVIAEFRSILSSSIAELKSALDMANVMQTKVLAMLGATGLALFNFLVTHFLTKAYSS